MLGNPNVHMLAGLLGGKPWVTGCQAKTASSTMKKPAEKSEPTSKPEGEKNPEAKKTECGEPTKTSKSANPATPNGLPGILADLTPLLGPVQSEQLSQFLGNILGSQQQVETGQKKPEQELQEHLGQLGGLISGLIGPAAVEAAFPLLEALAKAGQAQEETQSRQEPAPKEETEQKKNMDVESEKEKSPVEKTETQDENKEDSDFELIPEASSKTNVYPTLPTEEQTHLWKTDPRE